MLCNVIVEGYGSGAAQTGLAFHQFSRVWRCKWRGERALRVLCFITVENGGIIMCSQQLSLVLIFRQTSGDRIMLVWWHCERRWIRER